MAEQYQEQPEMSDEEALMKIADAMRKSSDASTDEKQSVFNFLFNVASAKDTTKIGNLRDDKDMNELGKPYNTVRGCKQMALISDKIMGNEYFKDFFLSESENTLSTSLSREGFLIKQGTTKTSQVVDATRRRKINKGWFGKESVEEQGGDILANK